MYRKPVVISTLITLAVSTGVIAGWFFDFSLFGESIVEMNATTAVCFMVASLALLLHNTRPQNPTTERALTFAAAFIMLVSFAKLLFFFGYDTGIDSFYYKSHWGIFPTDSTNRMAPNTAICMAFLSFALFGVFWKRPLLKEICILIVGNVAIFAIVGYIYMTKSFYMVTVWIPMAPHTAFCFAILTFGIISSSPTFIFSQLLNPDSKSGRIGRRALPVVILLPLIFGWLRLQGQKSELYSSETGIALFAIIMLLSMVTMIVWTVSLLSKNEQVLLRLNADLESKAHERFLQLTSAEESMRQLQKMDSIGRLAGGVAHDFNNMLAVINLYCDSLTDTLKDEESLKYVEQIRKASSKSKGLTKQLLVFSRHKGVHLTPLDLNFLISDFEKMLKRLVPEHISLITRLQPNLSLISADQNQVEQVVMNLIVNAKDAMPEGGKIIIETSLAKLDDSFAATHLGLKPGYYVLLTITDNGTGMPKNIVSKIFEPFFTTKEFGKGTGLGLSTVYGIVKQMGGAIWVYSEVNIGSVFKIYIPALMSANVSIEQTSPAGAFVHIPANETILLVEDEDDLREVLSKHLRQYGYKVYESSNGAEALKAYSQYDDIDIVVTDVIMPVMTGPELIRQLKINKPGLKYLLLSGYMAESFNEKDIASPAHILTKPFNSQDLAAKIRLILNTN